MKILTLFIFVFLLQSCQEQKTTIYENLIEREGILYENLRILLLLEILVVLNKVN